MKCSLKKYGIWVSNMYVCVHTHTYTHTHTHTHTHWNWAITWTEEARKIHVVKDYSQIHWNELIFSVIKVQVTKYRNIYRYGCVYIFELVFRHIFSCSVNWLGRDEAPQQQWAHSLPSLWLLIPFFSKRNQGSLEK